ncbi:MAG: hypothetical protein HYX42_08115 [Polaromonas sp.]|uniref:hypothetical protein n=1 Tax=Polaromonas sp. TaxID=1869339 RepID=UPI0025DBC654|nr:hypothetical protein [Polaromonas sp.]MBI2726199.1 hypothetical protein [Polaromonas sp.]
MLPTYVPLNSRLRFTGICWLGSALCFWPFYVLQLAAMGALAFIIWVLYPTFHAKYQPGIKTESGVLIARLAACLMLGILLPLSLFQLILPQGKALLDAVQSGAAVSPQPVTLPATPAKVPPKPPVVEQVQTALPPIPSTSEVFKNRTTFSEKTETLPATPSAIAIQRTEPAQVASPANTPVVNSKPAEQPFEDSRFKGN